MAKDEQNQKVTKKDVIEVKKISEELFNKIGIKSKPEVKEDKENQAVSIYLEGGNESGLIIGNRGETLNSLQSVIGMIFRKKRDKWLRVILDVADWREKEKTRLTDIAIQAAERAKTTGDAQSLYNLTANQRRIVHMALVDDKEIQTESEGEGRDRYLQVSVIKK